MPTNDINAASLAVESFVRTFEALGATPVATQVRPSGDDVDAIKVWVDLGPSSVDIAAWIDACEAAITAGVPAAAGFRVQVRAEKL